jgi:hypothetical protein
VRNAIEAVVEEALRLPSVNRTGRRERRAMGIGRPGPVSESAKEASATMGRVAGAGAGT